MLVNFLFEYFLSKTKRLAFHSANQDTSGIKAEFLTKTVCIGHSDRPIFSHLRSEPDHNKCL